MLAPYTIFVPTRAPTEQERIRIFGNPIANNGPGHQTITVAFPPGFVLCPDCPLDFMAIHVIVERLEQMARSGCK